MKIIRNGIEYGLTYEEMCEIYCTMKREYLRENIACKAEEMDIELSEAIICCRQQS